MKHISDKTLVISLSEKHKVKNFVHINFVSNFYMIYEIYKRIKDVAKTNNVKISLFLSKCNKHTISNILNLKRLGLENIYLSKCTPIMLNPTLTNTLKTVYGICPTTTPKQDAKNCCSN